jgi:hypothetical protein
MRLGEGRREPVAECVGRLLRGSRPGRKRGDAAHSKGFANSGAGSDVAKRLEDGPEMVREGAKMCKGNGNLGGVSAAGWT